MSAAVEQRLTALLDGWAAGSVVLGAALAVLHRLTYGCSRGVAKARGS